MLSPTIFFQKLPFSETIKENIATFTSNLTRRIKEIALSVFTKMSELFRSFRNQSKEMNSKTIGMLSCLTVIALIAISLFRRRDKGVVKPPDSDNKQKV